MLSSVLDNGFAFVSVQLAATSPEWSRWDADCDIWVCHFFVLRIETVGGIRFESVGPFPLHFSPNKTTPSEARKKGFVQVLGKLFIS